VGKSVLYRTVCMFYSLNELRSCWWRSPQPVVSPICYCSKFRGGSNTNCREYRFLYDKGSDEKIPSFNSGDFCL